MTSTHGYFLNVVTGEVIAIVEHATAICQSPEVFGLSRADVSELSPVEDRIEILEKVLLRGWIRIRHRKHEVAIEFVTAWEDTLEAVAESVSDLGLGDRCWINFHQIATGESLGVHVHELRQRFNQGMINDLVDRIEMK